MTRAFLTRSLGLLAFATLLSGSSALADPIVVTSGQFTIGDEEPGGFRFLGADGFVLSGGPIGFDRAPRISCFRGPCAPGTPLNLSTVTGSTALVFLPFATLGLSGEANINGTQFFTFPSRQGALAGTLRFDAPTVTLPDGSFFHVTAPFVLRGDVSGFALDDVNATTPLFHVNLVGQGTVTVSGEEVAAGRFGFLETMYIFAPAPVPEPTTLVLLATGFVGLTAPRRASKARRMILSLSLSSRSSA